MRAPTTDVQPTETDGEFDHSIRPLTSLEPRQTLDVLLAAEKNRRSGCASAGPRPVQDGIGLRCSVFRPESFRPISQAAVLAAYPTSEAPPLPKGNPAKAKSMCFAYEGGSEGRSSSTKPRRAIAWFWSIRKESSAECQHSEAHSAAVVTIGRICTASSVGDAASGLRAQ